VRLTNGCQLVPRSDAPMRSCGIIPRLFDSLFARLRASRAQFDVRCTAVEIYNERVFDLITFGKDGVEIWEDEDRGLTLTGATEVPVFSGKGANTLFRDAVKNRKTYETNMNAVSSRSHCVFILTIAKRAQGGGGTTFCQLYLADLAGSERVWKTGADGDRLDEAKYINKSLLALGQVISALADEDKKHVPYRDSKLTRLLQNSLGGNSRTALVITLSPSGYNARESLGTCRFGDLSSRIKNTAVANTIVTEDQLEDMLALSREKRTRNEGESVLRAGLVDGAWYDDVLQCC
jgi:kinesin family member 5